MAFEPVLTPLHDVRAFLFGGMRGLFVARDRVTAQEAPERAVAHRDALGHQRRARLLQRQVGRRLHSRQNRRRLRFRGRRTAIAAYRRTYAKRQPQITQPVETIR